jgi:hypothetical protein
MNRFETELVNRRGQINGRCWHYDRATHQPAQIKILSDGSPVYSPGNWRGVPVPGFEALERAGSCRRRAAASTARARLEWLRHAREWLQLAVDLDKSSSRLGVSW